MSSRAAQEVRIIGGKWKGRKLRFTGDRTLRPTLGRTRETLFNWLRPYIHARSCLDLFAGSGVLGLEALSQGAGSATFVDTNARTIHALSENIATLEAQGETHLHRADALKWLRTTESSFDIVFLDPPFERPALLEQALNLLKANKTAKHFIYIEASARCSLDESLRQIDATELKSTRAGDTQAVLLRLS